MASLSAIRPSLAALADPQKGKINEYQRLLDGAKRSRLPYDKELWLNVMFYIGEQYVQWNVATATVDRAPRNSKERHSPRPVSNKIMHFVQSELASVTQQRPNVDVLPASEDPGDISNANVALAYLKWLSEPLITDFNGVVSEAALWALASTEGYIKWTWDADAREGKGQGCIEAVSPLDVYIDPYAKRFKDCRYIIHSRFMDTEQVYDKFGIQVAQSNVEKADPVKVGLLREMGMAPVLTGVTVNELWMKPNRRHPDGVYCVWTNDQMVVEPTAYPYDHKRLPFTQIGSIKRPGSAHYTSAVSFLRSPQMELNKIHQQMIKTREAFANPKWFIPSELELESDPDDSPNQILRGNTNNGVLKPMLVQPTMMPPNDAGEWVVTEMQDIVGIHDVSSGQVPGRVESGSAISQLQDSDDSRLSELNRTIEVAITEGYYQQLMLARQFHDEEQMISAYSLEGIAEVHHFMAAKLDPGMRVKVQMTNGLASNRATRTQQLLAMWQQQIIRDPEVMAELMDVPVSSISPDNTFDIRLARNENYTMQNNTPITPNSWDNHDIHRREHNNFRKTQEFLNLPQNIKIMFEYHVHMHDQLQIQSLGQQLQIQEQAALVANGAGFQQGQAMAQQQQAAQGQPPQAPQSPGQGQPQSPPAQTGPPKGTGAGAGAPMYGAGSRPPVNLDDIRNTPQGAASYITRYSSELSKA